MNAYREEGVPGGRKCRGPAIRKLSVNSYKIKLRGFCVGDVTDGYESIWETRVILRCKQGVWCGFLDN